MERISLRHWTPPWIRREHVARYRWACRFTAGRRVVDVACGTGYGLELICREGGPLRIDGFDISPEAIEEARSRCTTGAPARVEVADATRLPAADHSYDVYLSFETIEHLRSVHTYLEEAVRVLVPGGMFVCSTPNRAAIRPGATLDQQPLNRYHFREYDFDEFDALLRPYFSHVEWYGQLCYPAWYGRIQRGLAKLQPYATARLHQLQKLCGHFWRRESAYAPRLLDNGSHPEIFIAVCTVPRPR